MKEINYSWDGEIYLLHIEANCPKTPSTIEIIRNGLTKEKRNQIRKVLDSTDRFIVMRLEPSEKSIVIRYDDEMIISLYELEDRAYYPVKPVHVC